MALYLKYRPLDFSSLVWQEFIKSTLKAAVSQDKTIWAYIFTGPRWTGKTSTARIFAKAINCENPKDGDPCLECGICKAFADENLIDIIEIDAASHTGVDNIREIIEKAQFRPTQSKFKIYIIDEVHMLSKWAFNALLKILEEPPKHVKFILATTEIHKVPDTILSRCQRYDFKNFSADEISGRLKHIAKQEGITVDDESYNYIVKSAEGWMRNAVSLFEQLVRDNTISYDSIIETLWIMSEDEKNNFIAKLMSQDTSILDDFETISGTGKNLKIFFKDILTTLQSQSIHMLQAWDDISWNIHVMDMLSDMLMKSKNSFDEVITYRIGLLKIISHYTSPSSNNNISLPQTSTMLEQRKTQTKKLAKPDIWAKQNTDNLIASAEDIFTPEVQESSSKKWSYIDIDALILAAKNNWWKAALSMTLKWSSYDLQWDILHISTKTTIAKNTLDKTDNRDVLFLALESIGTKVSDITVS